MAARKNTNSGRLSPGKQKAIAAKYTSGQTIRQLADAYMFSYTGMHTLLERNGVTFRRRGMPEKEKV